MSDTCTCGSGITFASCCAPFLSEAALPPTAEALMRSRYSAYVHCAVDYLLETTHPSQRSHYSRRDIERWSRESTWMKLEIISSTDTTVDFRAWYTDPQGIVQVHREHSTFVRENGRWYFLEGEVA